MLLATDTQTVAGLLRGAAARLEGLSDSPQLDAELLLGAVLGRDRAGLRARPEHRPSAAQLERFAALLEQRGSGEPLAYLLGHREFWSMELRVNRDVLVPRPETELLVETALARLADAGLDVLELGTGSGAIACALARERRRWRIVATDVSATALAVAAGNLRRHGLGGVELLSGSWYAPVAGRRFDAIVTNPPYVAAGDPHLRALSAEPALALLGGDDGLDALRAIAAGAADHLNAGGWLMSEHGATQGAATRALCRAAGLTAVETLRDAAGLERLTLARRGEQR